MARPRTLALLLLAATTSGCPSEGGKQRKQQGTRPIPVEVAPIEQGTIELRRTFSGTLEATARFRVAAKVSGRVERLLVDVADVVTRNQLVAVLDDAEFKHAVTQSEADLAVAKATLAEAESALGIETRELERAKQMRKRGVASDSQLDLAKADELAKRAAVLVAAARVKRAEASLAGARIRLGYTQVRANWSGDDHARRVAERFLDPGETVAANAPLLSIVQTAPITAVVFVTERDYGRMQDGQRALLKTDAFPGRTFTGTIARIAPVFRATSRQARVELSIANPKHELKPGMFARAVVELDRVEGATIVPRAALVKRKGTGVFVVSGDGKSVAWRAVTIGIRQGSRVQVTGAGLAGRVVTLGQQLLKDGASITIPEQPAPGADTK